MGCERSEAGVERGLLNEYLELHVGVRRLCLEREREREREREIERECVCV